MKKPYAFGVVSLLVMLMINGLSGDQAVSYTSGALEAMTGSPGDGDHCGTSCHATDPGTPTGNELISLTSNLPETGYLAGVTYDFTATMSDTSVTKFGFEISPQNVNGELLGTLIAGPETGLVGLNKYVTHTFTTTVGSGSRSWDFQWVAPEVGTGDVTFYGAFNFTNANGQTNGDVVVLADTTVSEGVSIGVNDRAVAQLSAYPIPATDFFYVDGVSGKTNYALVDLSGRTVQKGSFSSSTVSRIDLDRCAVKPGVHFLRLTDSGSDTVIKILVE